MSVRTYLEELEEKNLSPYATLSRNSRGRERPEEKCDVRTDFQRDRDRIIYSKAFRRLKHKTQVFISPEGDHYRTRLTHTLEVSQIARTIARGLRLNEDLTEAIALGHDLGHTPFGHAGERVLDRMVSKGFKHNEQSVRVVSFLEKDRKGLNLTWEVLDGIQCHTGNRLPATLEGQIIRYADKIAYINHDIEDAIRGGILREEDIPKEAAAILGRSSSQRINNMIVNIIENSGDGQGIRMSREFQEATNLLRDFMFQKVYIGSAAKKEETKAERMLRELFIWLMEHPDYLPDDFRNSIHDVGLEQCVTDYVAGMTDRYAVRKFNEIFVPVSWLE
ncbi:MAG TPA: deoxyguanosinetriphosphate triphosphohydrolase [Thermoclostridium caenicola]|uniref:deoxyguanosinetriphosphate triphosphohydrolase n=1 Tax=Thermoclostridium caenicola TaxID=659425 RepID=UPI002C2591E2|nr:deoxyguanosinetriphosphate triphosphohydrolase [Thermoclostridium caenicola]HOK42077.1 deoxyguanosinetriphosphate triphosphohydrolase [Thermoclostridium caenicola]HOL85242.1 deoxyguanosinetriphosphate triphosphohydrolase [Thermoclostridium caenicola]HPO75639.1 deoxyguanosinetriphosphate triphosphohydrolase [Thermoclostridium caenicola]